MTPGADVCLTDILLPAYVDTDWLIETMHAGTCRMLRTSEALQASGTRVSAMVDVLEAMRDALASARGLEDRAEARACAALMHELGQELRDTIERVLAKKLKG